MRPARIHALLEGKAKKLPKPFVPYNFQGLRKAARILAEALLLASIVLVWPRPLPAQHTPPTASEVEAFAERAHSEANPGEKVHLPDWMFKKLMEGASASYPHCDPGNRSDLEAHQFTLGPNLPGGLAILGHGGCFCSPTANCSFWVYEIKNGKYRLVLNRGAVEKFGFLRSRTHGYPDLVAWANGSATEYEARLFRFNGNRYVASGGWEVDYEWLDENGNIVDSDKPRITSHFSSKDQLPDGTKP